MELRPLTLKNKEILHRYLKKQPHNLSNYSFENNFIWRVLFELEWAEINNRFCLFFKDKTGCFMNMPPLGGLNEETVSKVFKIMEDFNHNPLISRIENIEEGDLAFFSALGGFASGGKKNNYRIYEKSKEYIVLRDEMAYLKGEKFRHKRNLYNFFQKNFNSVFRDYEPEDEVGVLRLCADWMKERMLKNDEPIYRAMLNDSYKALGEMLLRFKDLNMLAKVVECDGKIKGFTSGFAVREGLFCINFEIADLKVKGLAQFIFSEFSKTLEHYPHINIMDDSGILGVRQTKLSYRPLQTISSYTAVLKS